MNDASEADAVRSRLEQIVSKSISRNVTADDLVSPNFENAKWLESWEWYVDSDVRILWPKLCSQARLIACLGAVSLWRRENEAAN